MQTLLAKIVPRAIYDFKLHQATKGVNFSFNNMTFIGKVVDVYDGDTITVVFRYGGKLQQHRCRMLGYDSPEMKPLRSKVDRDLEITEAKKARQALLDLIDLNHGIVRIKCHHFDKYGRILIDLYIKIKKPKGCWIAHRETIWVNPWMIENGFGVPYDGGAKK